MGKKWKRILRLRRNAARDATAPAPSKAAVAEPAIVTEEAEETTAKEVVAKPPKVSKKSKSSKTTKRTTKK